MGKARAGEPGLWGSREEAGQGMLLHQEQGRNRHSRGWSPKQVPPRSTGFSRGTRRVEKPWAQLPAKPSLVLQPLGGLPAPSTSLLLTPPARAAGREPLFSSFPFQGQPSAACPAWEGAAASPCHPLLRFQQVQPQPDGKPKAFFHNGMLQRGQEELPGHGCSAWGRSSVRLLAH